MASEHENEFIVMQPGRMLFWGGPVEAVKSFWTGHVVVKLFDEDMQLVEVIEGNVDILVDMNILKNRRYM